MSVWIGKTLGKVHIDKLLGRGGMAEVYLGTHTTLERPVAVKFLHGYLEENTDLFERFQREARVVAGLRHSNIIQVFDYDVADERPYIVMEYVNGPSLSSYMRSVQERGGRMPLGMIRRMLPLLASALDYAHQHGVVHRDIKPANVLLYSKSSAIELGEGLPTDTEPLLADFGLVRVMDSAKQTSTGLITGTPAYMSPEQARGEHADHRSDVYSLGVLLYEMLSGRVPFEADTPTTVMNKVLFEPPPPITSLSPEMQTVIDRALHKDPNLRYQTAGQLSNAFLGALGNLTQAETLPPVKITKQLTPSSLPGSPGLQPKPAASQPRLSVWAILSVVVAVALIFVALAPRLFPSLSIFPGGSAVTVTMEMTSPGPAQITSVGILRFQDVAGRLDGVTVLVDAIPAPEEGTHYEAWLTGGENRRSLGVLELDAEGNGNLSFVDEQSRNLLARYDSMELTVEPSPDPSPNSSGVVAFSSGIPNNALTHARHVLISIGDTPNQIGLIEGLWNDSMLVDGQANDMLEAFDAGDKAAAMKNAEAIVNLIVGSHSPDYGDLDHDGEVADPGDGYGLLLNGESPGYTEGVISHTKYAMSGGDASTLVLLHGGHVIVSVNNVERWLVQLRDLCLQILEDAPGSDMRGTVVKAVALADQIVNGVDLDGNERVDPVPGEGGVKTAYQHAYYMADMEILPGRGQIMPPGPTPAATPEPYQEK